jgi:stage II sporulation protein D
LVVIALLLIGVTTLVSPAFSDEINDLEGEIDSTNQSISQAEEILIETKSKIDEIMNSNLSVSQKIAAMEEDIGEINERIKTSELNIEKKQKEISDKEVIVIEKKEDVESVSRSLYKNSRMTLLELMLSQEKSGDLLRSYVFKKYTVNRQSAVIKELNKEIETLSKERKELEESKKALDSEKIALDESKAILDNEKARILQEIYAQAALRAELEREIISLNSDLANLSSELQKAIANKAAKDTGGTSGGGSSTGGTSPQPPSGYAGEYDIFIGNTQISDNSAGPIRIVSTSNNNAFTVNGGLSYRGILEFRSDTNVFLINELPFEQYLQGIGEVPSSWPTESLKTQAVAARTYAAKNWNKRMGSLYNLRDDTFDQNYVGFNKEVAVSGDRWVASVNSTAGKAIYSGNSPIGAYYHSTCGGHTLGSEEVWVSALPYTRPESDWYQSNGLWKSYDGASPWSYKKWGSATINDTQMVDLVNAAIYLSVDPNSSSRQNDVRRADLGGLSTSALETALGTNKMQDRIGDLTNVQSIYNNGSTAIDSSAKNTYKVRIRGVNGMIDIDARTFWLVYNLRSPGDLTLYYSNFWTSVKEGGSWNFYTRGYPHRVGMCQYGAYGRAQAGQSYTEILQHYYRGTTIKDFNPPSNFRVGITRVATGNVFITNRAGGNYEVYSNGEYIGTASSSESMRIVKQ